MCFIIINTVQVILHHKGYASLDRGEENKLVQTLIETQTVAYVDAPAAYIYIFHGGNTWGLEHFNKMFECTGEFLPPAISKEINSWLAVPDGQILQRMALNPNENNSNNIGTISQGISWPRLFNWGPVLRSPVYKKQLLFGLGSRGVVADPVFCALSHYKLTLLSFRLLEGVSKELIFRNNC